MDIVVSEDRSLFDDYYGGRSEGPRGTILLFASWARTGNVNGLPSLGNLCETEKVTRLAFG